MQHIHEQFFFFYLIQTLLDKSSSLELVEKLIMNKTAWQTGKITAGKYAAQQKNNLQLDRNSDDSHEMSNYIIAKMYNYLIIEFYNYIIIELYNYMII